MVSLENMYAFFLSSTIQSHFSFFLQHSFVRILLTYSGNINFLRGNFQDEAKQLTNHPHELHFSCGLINEL